MNKLAANKEISDFLGVLCVELGFCIPPDDQDRIASLGSWEATEFAKDVIEGEGLNPEYQPKWVREIRNRFIEQFGSNVFNSSS